MPAEWIERLLARLRSNRPAALDKAAVDVVELCQASTTIAGVPERIQSLAAGAVVAMARAVAERDDQEDRHGGSPNVPAR
jgi:hypothetical protein